MTKYATAKTQAGRQRQVAEGRADMTRPGGLTKNDLKKNKIGRWVSKKRSKASKKSYKSSGLVEYQYHRGY